MAVRAVEGRLVPHRRVDSVRYALGRARVTAEELGAALSIFQRFGHRKAKRPLASLFGTLRHRRLQAARRQGVYRDDGDLGAVLMPEVRLVEDGPWEPRQDDEPGVARARAMMRSLCAPKALEKIEAKNDATG